MKTTLRIALPLLFCIALLLCLTPATWAEAGDFVFPANTTVIEDEAFLNCAWMKTITIPAGVTHIGNGAFSGCTGLTDIYYDGTLEQWGTIVIGDNNEALIGATLHCDSVSGVWGSLSWTLESEGLLTISGDGEMDGFYNDRTAAWHQYENIIKEVEITFGVTSIGDVAFSQCNNLIAISIPESITKIGENAFNRCINLKSIEIPCSVKSIGFAAFYSCESMTSVTIAEGLTSIAEYSFQNCTSLTNADIPSSVTNIGHSAFYNCRSLVSASIPDGISCINRHTFYGCSSLVNVNIPNSVTSIDRSAFNNCSSLTNITIPSGITSISDYTFYGCSSLSNVIIPDGVTSIGYAAFCNCMGLKTIVIPTSVTSLGEYVFYECNQLTNVIIPEGVSSIGYAAFFDCVNLMNMTIPNGVTSIGEYAFCKCSGLASVVIPSSVTTVGKSAFSGCTSLNDVYYTGTPNEWNAIAKGDNNEPLSNADLHFSITLNSIGSNQHILGRPEHLQFRSDIPLFNTEVFVNDEKWTRDTQFSLSSDGTILTLDCLALDSLVAGTHSVKISMYSLNASANFEILNPVIMTPEITLQPQSQTFDASNVGWPTFIVHAIGGDLTYTWEYRYNNTEDWLTLCDVNPSYGSLVRSPTLLFNPIIWYAYTSQQGSDLSFHADISYNGLQFRCKVSNSAGVTYSNIATLTVKCTQIFSHITQGGKAYYSTETDHSEKLLLDRHSQYADVGDTVYVRAVPDAGYKTDIQIVSTTDGTGTEIPANGDQASGNSNNMLTALPDGSVSFVMPATGIDLYVSFRMPTIIASGTWGDLTWSLDEDGLLRISGNGEMSPFNDDDMTSAWHNYSSDIYSIVLDSGVTSIGNYAFNNCSNIESIAFSKDVANVGRWALDGCSGLIKFEVDEANQAYCDIDGVLFSKSIDTIERYPAARTGAYVIPEGVSVIGDSAFYECKNLTDISIPESVTKIEAAAFYCCSGLDSVILPHGLTSLGSTAFYGCSNLSYIRVYEATTNFGDRAFASCANLKTAGPIGGNYNVEFGWISLIPENVFSNCDSLTSIVIPDSVESFGRLAFSGCSGLTYIPLPSSLQRIGESALSECSGIKSLLLPLGVTEIGEWAFSDCTSLESAFIPSRVKTLSNRLFSNCSSLSNVSLSYGLESIGEYAFAECSSLSEISIPSTVTSIGEYAFYNCGMLSSITVPESTTEFGNNIFTGCTNLKTAGPIGGNYDYSFGWKDTIPANAFRNCEGLIEVVFPDSVATIGDRAFENCYALSNVSLPKRLANINDRAFSYCRSLTSVTIPGGVDCIGTSAFKYCSGLTTVTMEEGVTGIGEDAFYECRNLTSVAIPSSMQSVGKNAFYNCNSLNAVYYSGSEQQWKNISFGSNNTRLTSAPRYYTSTSQDGKVRSGIIQQGDGWALRWLVNYTERNGSIIDPELTIRMEGVDNSGNWKYTISLTVDDKTPWLTATGLDRSAFKKITVRGSSQNPLHIVDHLFTDYTSVTDVFLSHVEGIDTSAFENCTSLVRVNGLDSDLRSISQSAFKNDEKLMMVYGSGNAVNLKMIGNEAFMNTSIMDFSFPKSVETIGSRAFYSAKLGSIHLGGNIREIGTEAFVGNLGITIYCYRDSEAHRYAKRDNINCKLYEEISIPVSFIGYEAKFSDSYFSKLYPPANSNNDLATLCGILCWAVYNDSDKPSMLSVFNDLGISSNDVYESPSTTYHYAIAKKEINVDGEKANLLIICLKGTNQWEEIIDDHYTKADTDFHGYKAYDTIYNFEESVLYSVNRYYLDHPEIGTMPLKVLITGHSLGGAGANLLAARIIGFASDLDWWTRQISKNDIYVYTFASIDSIKSDNVISEGFENIHNIYNYHDSYGPHGWKDFTAAGHSGHGKFGHIDLFYKEIDNGQFGIEHNQNHMMGAYMDALKNGEIDYENPSAQAILDN